MRVPGETLRRDEDVLSDTWTLLARGLGPRGQWPGWAQPDADPHAGRHDLAAPLTALGMLALRGLPDPEPRALLDRSREHLERTVLPSGLWRYYANIPPDTDDSAMCALALGPEHPTVRQRTRPALLATRRPDGLFPTWLEPGWSAVVDPVANAHVAAVIGPGPETDAATAWLNVIVASGQESVSSAYYPDPLDLHVAIARAVDAGVGSLAPALAIAARRAADRLGHEGSPYRLAQALLVARHDPTVRPALLAAGVARLLRLREPAGGWPPDTLFVAGDTARPGRWRYRSWAVVSALCARAVAELTAAGEE